MDEDEDKKDPNGQDKDIKKTDAETIAELKKQLEDITTERDKFKTERDEANANLINMTQKSKGEDKSKFDEIFGGLR